MGAASAERGMFLAFARDELFHVYQPIIDLTDRSVNAVEALVRWRHPERGVLTPGHFMEQIEAERFWTSLTRVTLENLARDLPQLFARLGHDLNVGFNLSSAQIGDPSTLDQIDHILPASDFDRSRLVVEVVEDLRSEHLDESTITIAGLRERGIRVVLDDFGTGAGTLSLLTDLSYDGLKIDRHFVSRIRLAGPARSVVESMINFAAENGVIVVAEGVEDEAILRELIQMGCRYAQGFHLGHPVPLDQLESDPTQRATKTGETKLTETELVEWRQAIAERVPFDATAKEADLIELIGDIETELDEFAGIGQIELRIDLGFRKMLAALYGGCNRLAMDWGMDTSRLAENHGLLGRSATILSVVAGISPDPTAEQTPSAEALARAVTLRMSIDLDPVEQTTIDNNLGTTLANLGLVDLAHGWHMSAVRNGVDCRSWPIAALNLAEASLDRLNGAPWVNRIGNDTDREVLDEARDVLAESEHTPTGLAEAIEARVLIQQRDLTGARDLLFGNGLDLDAVSFFSVLTARSELAAAAGQAEGFLAETERLLEFVRDNHALRFQAVRTGWMRVEALAKAGRHREAFELQKKMTREERANSVRHMTGFFDWMQLVVAVDSRYGEMVDLTERQR